MRAKFTILEDTDSHILLRDDCLMHECMSITNDAEAVIEYLINNKIVSNNKIVYYIDTDNRVDILNHDGKKFLNFLLVFKDLDEFNKRN